MEQILVLIWDKGKWTALVQGQSAESKAREQAGITVSISSRVQNISLRSWISLERKRFLHLGAYTFEVISSLLLGLIFWAGRIKAPEMTVMFLYLGVQSSSMVRWGSSTQMARGSCAGNQVPQSWEQAPFLFYYICFLVLSLTCLQYLLGSSLICVQKANLFCSIFVHSLSFSHGLLYFWDNAVPMEMPAVWASSPAEVTK